MSERRQFLKFAVASTASLCCANRDVLRGLEVLADETPPATIRFGPELEPLVRLMEETPRDQCVRVFVDQLRRGLPYRKFLAASMMAAVRRARSNHEVYKIQSMHQVSMEAQADERLLPLFWGLNGF